LAGLVSTTRLRQEQAAQTARKQSASQPVREAQWDPLESRCQCCATKCPLLSLSLSLSLSLLCVPRLSAAPCCCCCRCGCLLVGQPTAVSRQRGKRGQDTKRPPRNRQHARDRRRRWHWQWHAVCLPCSDVPVFSLPPSLPSPRGLAGMPPSPRVGHRLRRCIQRHRGCLNCHGCADGTLDLEGKSTRKGAQRRGGDAPAGESLRMPAGGGGQRRGGRALCSHIDSCLSERTRGSELPLETRVSQGL
jgi:hypothetical protein